MRTQNIDVIFQKDIYCGFAALLLHVFTRAPFYIDEHNVEFIRLRRMGNPYWWFIRMLEELSCRYAAGVFTVSDLDKRHVIKYFRVPSSKVTVIENGCEFRQQQYANLDISLIRETNGITPIEKVLLFYGNLNYKPNIQAVQIIVGQIIKRLPETLHYKVWIMGKGDLQGNLHLMDHPKVVFLGEKQDIYPYIIASDLVIVPLVSGGGTRIKIIESIAAGKMVVSTTLGAEGLDLKAPPGRSIIIQDDWDQFAHQIVKTLSEPNCCPLTPRYFVDRFSWQNIARNIIF
jgi:glycosyltransferase involved in cell wall biosynthesis